MKAGGVVEDYCRVCRDARRHTVIAARPDGVALRVLCDTCGSQHNYRGTPGPVPSATRSPSDMSPDPSEPETELETVLRRVIRQEAGLTPVTPADRWRGGQLVLRPGRPGIQEKTWPIDAFFHKVVMLRNRLRVLEQQINSTDELPSEAKLKLQGYITACYGSLTSFNVLFADPEDRFVGSGGKEED
ncbi:MAG TPA: hypothetical protein VJS92_13600 [Candidatus Polarisedimenticolaceae bacterium]|nr:hypothetical protein [Candidatus Polarisedimenticolaceae bacterium]